jgi:predicted alpha/beta-hydrolase family hydrolase
MGAIESPLPIIERIETPHGLARAEIRPAAHPLGALVLGHGAGGGTHAPDLLAATAGATEASCTVALVEQPYRVAGRRSPAPARQLDAAWRAVIASLRDRELRDLPLVVGGRSAGARVACRTAGDTGAAGVVCLAFPVHPPGKGDDPRKSRLPELEAVPVPLLVVQGDRDPFGMPPDAPGRTVVRVPGDHSLRKAGDVRAAVRDWLAALLTS